MRSLALLAISLAAVVFAATPTFPRSTLAAPPTPTSTGNVECGDGPVSFTISVDKRVLAVEGRERPPVYPASGDSCWFTVTLSESREVAMELKAPCELTVYGRVHAAQAREVNISSTGDCTGVAANVAEYDWMVQNTANRDALAGGSLAPARLTRAPVSGIDLPVDEPEDFGTDEIGAPGAQSNGQSTLLSTTTGWKHAKIIGWDILDLPMFWNYVNMRHTYDGSTVSWAETQWAYWTDDWWYLSGSWLHQILFHNGNRQVEGYSYTSLHSDGFPTPAQPDTHAYVQPAVWGYGWGGQSCSFYNVWSSPYPGFHWSLICQQLT